MPHAPASGSAAASPGDTAPAAISADAAAPAATSPATSRRLVELSGPAASAALSPSSIVVLPTGAIEHHGPHLPLMTDFLIADAVANAAVSAAAAEGLDVWVLPALAYTKSDEHHWAGGTMWISWDTLMRTVVELGGSLAASGVTKLVFFNGQGGNLALLQVACRELRRRFGLQTFLMGATVPPGDHDGPEELGLGIHAGHAETSLVLHLRPELVDLGVAVRSVPEHLAEFEHIGFRKRVTFGWLSDDFGTDGTLGDPTGATAAYGAELFAASVTDAVAAFTEIARFDPAGPTPIGEGAAEVSA